MTITVNDHQMKNPLTLTDIGVLAFYFTLLIGVGLCSMLKSNLSTVQGYFLANRQMA